MHKGEGKYILIDIVSSFMGVGAVFLFIKDHIILGLLIGAASFFVSNLAHKARDNGRADEALEAKAEYDRLHEGDLGPGSPRQSADD